MSYLDKVTVGSTTYDIQDTKAQGDIGDLKSAENAHEQAINGNNLILTAGYKVRNAGTSDSPLFTLNKGAYSISRSSSAVGNAARIYIEIPQDLTENKFTVHVTANCPKKSDGFMNIQGYTAAPSAYNDSSSYVETYKTVNAAANVLYDETFEIEVTDATVKVIVFYFSVGSSQTTASYGTIDIWPSDATGLVNGVKALSGETESLDGRVTAVENRMAAEIVLPSRVEFVGGIEYNLYHQNAIRNFNVKTAYRIGTSKTFTDYEGFSRWTPASDASQSNQGFSFQFAPFNNGLGTGADKTINYDVVPSTAGTGLTKKVLLIGDSLTFNDNPNGTNQTAAFSGIARHLVSDLFADDAMAIELIGTLGEAPYLREGRAGWSATDYVHKDSVDSVNNAFYNPTSQTFDFEYYMTENSFSGVDYVFINLGTNLASEGMEVTVADMVDDLETMVESIHGYNANIRVGVWTPPPRALIGNGRLPDNDNTLDRVKAILTAFDGKQSERTYIVPVNLFVDPYHDFPMQSINVSARNTAYQMNVATDKTHPSDAGYYHMADVIYTYIKYFGSLDA